MSVRGHGFAHLHTVDEAQAILKKKLIRPLDIEKISVVDSLGRSLAEDLIAPRDLPGFQRAAMDGFAVKAVDTYGASDTNPRQITVVGEIEIGDSRGNLSLKNGEAIKISTGAPIPTGATGVIMLEDCETYNDIVEVYNSIPEGKNIADKDEDLKKGDLILPKGTIIRPWDIGMILACSFETISVFEQPRIATLSTGNELVAISSDLKEGQVIDSNRPAINSWLGSLGCTIVETLSCKDDPDVIKQTLAKLSTDTHLIVTTGGTSVGSKDFLAEVIEELGELWVHGVAVRPGKPVALGLIENSGKKVPIIALPGYPLAAYLNFHLFVSYILEVWTGQKGILNQKITVKLNDKIPSKVGTRDFVRLKSEKGGASLIRISGAGILSSLINADYLLDIPDDLEGYNAGDDVDVYLLR